jgi:hypothetical protein
MLYDMGIGDRRIVIGAAKEYGVRVSASIGMRSLVARQGYGVLSYARMAPAITYHEHGYDECAETKG